MYITAMGVRGSGGEGVNTFRYEHGELSIPGMSWEKPDLPRIASQEPGDLVAERVEVAPGGNDVLCFLDIAAADSVSLEQVEAALDWLEAEVECNPASDQIRREAHPVPVWVRTGRRDGESLIEVFRELRSHVMALLAGGRRSPRPKPLIIHRRSVPDGHTYELEEKSLKRVQSQHQSKQDVYQPTKLQVGMDVGLDFALMHGPILSHVAAAVTGLDRTDILDLGGVVFVDGQTGELIKRWP